MAIVAVILLALLLGGPALVLALVVWLAISYFMAVLLGLLLVGVFFVWTTVGTRSTVMLATYVALTAYLAVYGGPFNPFAFPELVASHFGQHDHHE